MAIDVSKRCNTFRVHRIDFFATSRRSLCIQPISLLCCWSSRLEPQVVFVCHEGDEIVEGALCSRLAAPLLILESHHTRVVYDSLGNVHELMFLVRLVAEIGHEGSILDLIHHLGSMAGSHGVFIAFAFLSMSAGVHCPYHCQSWSKYAWNVPVLPPMNKTWRA